MERKFNKILLAFSIFLVFNTSCLHSENKEKREEIIKLRGEIEKELNNGGKVETQDYAMIWKRTKDPRILELYEKLMLAVDNEGEASDGTWKAVYGLMNIGTKEAKEILRKGLSNKFIRKYCIVALAKLGELEEMGPKIVEEKAYWLCYSFGCKEAIEYVRQGLNDKDDKARLDALHALRGFNDKYVEGRQKDILIDLLKSDNPEIRYYSASELASLIGKEAIPYLEKALDYKVTKKDNYYGPDVSPDAIRRIINNLREGVYKKNDENEK